MQENETQPITNNSEPKVRRKQNPKLECLRLQERDYLALKLICDFGYLTADQIAQHIFKSTNKNTKRRLGMLEKAGYAREFGISEVLLTCNDDNLHSIRVIEKNGGVLKDRKLQYEGGPMKRYYWIQL